MVDSQYQEIIKAAQLGGQVVRKYFGKELKIKLKSTIHDYQTKADLESERKVLGHLKKYFPGYNILSEEAGYIDKKSEYTFIVDPLDGSNNFVSNIPMVGVNIALVRNDETVFGVIYDIFLDRVYFAQKGKGAFLDNKKIKVSGQNEIREANIAFNCGYTGSMKYYEHIVHNLNAKKTKRIYTNWVVGIDFCLLACGKIDGIINNESEVYDFVAGKLIAKEAGATSMDFKGKKDVDKNRKFIAGCSRQICRELLDIL